MAEGWSHGEPGICVGQKGSLEDQCRRMEADRRLSPRVACRRGNAGRRLRSRVECRRWRGVGKSCTAGADAALRRTSERGKLVEKALVPQRVVQVVEVSQNVESGILERIVESIDDVFVPQW